VHANPSGPSHPDLYLLCSSAESADFAGRAGVGMVFAEFIARADADPAIVAYRAAFSPSPFRAKPFAAAALIAFAAETHEEAERLDAPRRAATLAFLEGRQLRFSTIETAQAFLADRRDDPRLAGVIARGIAGSAGEIKQALKNKALRSGADEIFVMSAGPSLETRIRSLELIAS
jgi:alkanesulfonate monooxygenase SsuD/methylene tetrahydromethanopterin reductase-like flavin-dependent oxidoreductase (luciferase family)